MVAAAAAEAPPALPFRVGHGWDLHRLEPGYPLIVGGIDIPHDRGCVAHSDGGRGRRTRESSGCGRTGSWA